MEDDSAPRIPFLSSWLQVTDDDPDQRISPVLWVFTFKASVLLSPLLSLALVPSLGLGGALTIGVLGIVPMALFYRLLCSVFLWRMGRPRTLGEMQQMQGRA